MAKDENIESKLEAYKILREQFDTIVKSEVEEKCRDLIKDYEIQLAEKDKKIEELEDRLRHYSNDLWYIDLNKLRIPKAIENQIRKQVYDEIYEFIMSHWEEKPGRYGYYNTNGRCDELRKDLDRIVKGE